VPITTIVLTWWVQIPLRRAVLDTTLCGKVWQIGVFSSVALISLTNKTGCHYITGILLKVALNTINPIGNSLGPKKNICVFTVTCQKNLGSVGWDKNIFFFFLLSTKPEIVVSGIRFRYLIFENSGKMTNYAVFLPSLLSISTKS
jgi:hypothetical protein